MPDQDADEKSDGISWRDGVPISRQFDDPYYALSDGLAETEHVFLRGNELPDRWLGAASAHIAELGFGTGLNFLAAWRLWRELAAPGARLSFTSFERYPLSKDEMAEALSPWPGLPSQALLDVWPVTGVVDLEGCRLELILGDAREALPRWKGVADTWFLDGFAPARNPELWEPDLLREVAKHTVVGGTFATYTAAGHVRRALQEAGFEVRREAGFAHKRHMSCGSLKA